MKIKKIFISIICLLFIQLVNASVVNASEVYFSYPSTVKAGEEFIVKLVIRNASNLKYVQATNYRIDSDKLELVDFDTITPFLGTGVGNSPLVTIDGAMGFEMNSQTPKSGNVEVLYLKFKVKETVRANDLINIKMDKVFISANEDGTNPENISNDEGYCLTIRVTKNQITETPKCKVVDGKYYDNNGNIVSKAAYEAACGIENPETGINTTIVVVITGTLLAIGCYAFFRKTKMYY